MMEIQQSNPDLIASALDRMPNFSEEIQSNSVLIKRIKALSAKKDAIK
jgi:hypothetical protein